MVISFSPMARQLDLLVARTADLAIQLIDSGWDNRSLFAFTAIAKAYAKTHLKREIGRGRLDLAKSLVDQSQLDSFAVDCIAELFARDDSGSYFILERFFRDCMRDNRLEPINLTIRLRGLIESRVHQSLIALFSRVDSGGFKLWRNLSSFPKETPPSKHSKTLWMSTFSGA